jgi:hypothetical protein
VIKGRGTIKVIHREKKEKTHRSKTKRRVKASEKRRTCGVPHHHTSTSKHTNGHAKRKKKRRGIRFTIPIHGGMKESRARITTMAAA